MNNETILMIKNFLKFFHRRNFHILIVDDDGEKREYREPDDALSEILEHQLNCIYFQDKDLELVVEIDTTAETLYNVFISFAFNHPNMDTLVDQAIDYVEVTCLEKEKSKG